MPPRKKTSTDQGELFSVSSTKEIQDILWKAADKLRGSMDAAQYKEFVLGLVFLKYVSDAFAERRKQIRDGLLADGMPEARVEGFLEDKDEYTGAHVFWVPETARWDYIAKNAKSEGPGLLLNQAMTDVMGTNDALAGILPTIFNSDSVDQRRLAELIDLIGDARFTGHGDRPAQDVLGEVYEYFLERFARAEGKRAGEFYTPASVVRLLVEMLEPYKGRVYDPCCGSGGMFVQAGKFVKAHRGKTDDISVYGQEANERTWRLAQMNLAIHGIDGKIGPRWADTFADDKHPDVNADFIMANPPFNMSDWHRDPDDRRWRYGAPPQSNANYAWLQHIVAHLGERGSAGVVLANGSMSSKQSGEGEIRKNMVEADLVACMVALPANLFRTTAIPACLWFLAKDKGTRAGQVLFIDAKNLGTMVDRTERIFTEDDLAQISDTYHAWKRGGYEDIAGFCYSAVLDDVRKHDYVLTPGRYVGAAEAEDTDGEPIEEKIERLTKELYAHFDESARLEAVVREQLGRI